MSKFRVSESENGFCSISFAPLWITLHMVTLTYPPYPTVEQRKQYSQWFLNFQYILPCEACRGNFKKNLFSIKFDEVIDFCTRHAFAKCVWRLHNEVNKALKKNIEVKFEDMNAFYEQLRATECDDISCKRTNRQPQCQIRFIPDKSLSVQKLLTIDKECAQSKIYYRSLIDP